MSSSLTFMGGGEMGHLDAPGIYNTPDPDEYVRISGDLLQERNGRYELRVTNELEEACLSIICNCSQWRTRRNVRSIQMKDLLFRRSRSKIFSTRNARRP